MSSHILRPIRNILRDTFRIFVDSHCFFAAAALAYFAFLSLIPFFILTASVMGFFLAGIDTTEASRVVTETAEQFLPFLQGELELRLVELIAARNITGLIGVVTLVGTATLFFLTVEQTFSAIFPGSALRGFWRSKGLALALIPLTVALLGFLYYAFLVVDTVIGAVSVPVFESLVDSALIDLAVSTAILAIEFCLVVYWFERGRIRLRNIAAGACAFCLLWTVARIGFTFYVQRVAAFSIVYGSLGALVALVVWVYYASLVFLIGCCVTEALRRHQTA